jgi:glycosyltransferase involved in cell wall biosynthesis
LPAAKTYRAQARSMFPADNMKITVILCTYNRCHSLANALDRVAAQTFSEPVEWEVLVVDNNSRDQTREVAEDFCRRYPGRFRYVFEPRQGKSYALNTAIGDARGDVLAFMDDDVIVDSAWLQNLTASVCSGEWVGAGGRILPQWPCKPPSWLPQNEWFGMAPLVMFDLGGESRMLSDPPFGANMAFHRKMFEKYGTFRIDLGPRPDSEIRSEDTEFGSRLLAAGERIKYEPAAVVHHEVPQRRLHKEFFLRWWFDRGRAEIRGVGVAADRKWFVIGIPVYLFRRVAVGTLRWMVTPGPSRRFSRRLGVWLVAGMMVESYRQSREVGHKREKLKCV